MRSRFAVILVFLLALAIRVERLVHDPVWYDEVVTLLRIEGIPKTQCLNDLEDVARLEIRDGKPNFCNYPDAQPELGHWNNGYMPAFYLMERALYSITGLNVPALKMLPAILGAITPIVIWGLLDTVVPGTSVGILAALFIAVHPALVAYSVELRSYSLLILCCSLFLRFLLSPMRDPRKQLFAMGAVLMIGGFTHLLFLPFAWVALAASYVRREKRERHTLHVMVGMLLVTSLAVSPWLINILFSTEADTHFSVQPVSRSDLYYRAAENLGRLAGIPSILGTEVIAAIAITLGISAFLATGSRIRLLLVALAAPFLGMLFIDYVKDGARSTVLRYNISLALFFCVVFALLIDLLGRKRSLLKYSLAAVLMALMQLAANDVNSALKGGQFNELAWYRSEYRSEKTVTLGVLELRNALEVLFNGGRDAVLFRIHVFPSQSAITELTDAATSGLSVVGATSVDRIPPNVLGAEWKWRRAFTGAALNFFTPVSRMEKTWQGDLTGASQIH